MNEHLIRLGRGAALLLSLACAATAWAGPTQGYWHEDASRILPAEAPHPASFRSLTLDTAMVAEYLRSAHERGIATEISLPQPDGGFAEFMVTDSGTMPETLQRKYPDIISLKGQDSQGRPLRLDVSPLGFQAMVFDPAGLWVVRPEVIGGNSDRYLSFRRSEQPVPEGMGACEVHGSSVDPAGLNLVPPGDAPMTQTGVTHRLYRAAVAANNRYITAVGGGTVAGGLAATVVAVNRVTQVYEYEMSIQLRLVENNDLLMFPDAASDPFASNGTGVINNSTSIINGIIGADAYDIGHVFTTGSGGVAGLGVVCGGSKARGTTGLPNPTGDSFYIDFVAHEMGHQFRANHPFNGSLINCSGGNRNGSTAYEPGSGSTIMAYAGICGADDLQPHSDPFFHAISLQEITNFTTTGSGTCSVNSDNANQAPVIDTASLPPAGLTIPMQTPFALNGTATDADAEDSVTYSWEEWDLGPQAPLTAGDNGSSPIFRAFPPVYTGERLFPKLSTILTGTAVKGETLPTTTRTLKFRLTARDMRPGWGTSQSADISLNVVNTAGPFQVTAPAAAASWAQGSTQSVTWNVANTNAAPVSCATVDIALSADGGQTFPYALASGVANSGSASVTTPNIATGKARVRVRCASNVFFDISHGDFTIPAAANTFPIGGTVSGLLGLPVTLHLSTGQDLAVAANGAFAFPIPLASGATYAVTVGANPSAPAQTCTVTNGSGTVSGAVSNVLVSCASAPLANYTIGGTVSGLTAGTNLTLRMNGSVDLTVSANSAFTFPTALADGSVYTVLIATQPADQACHLANHSGTVAHANVTDVRVTCPNGTTTYTVGGHLSGLHGTGLKLQVNGGDDLLPTADGDFTFATPLADGSAYEVTVATQPSGPAQTCTVTNGSGTIAGADVDDVEVACEDDVDDVIFKDGFDDGKPKTGFFENFDGYTAGSDAAGQGGWIGWGNDPSAGATVVDDPSSSAPNSVRIEGASDLVHPFSGYTSGSWTITAKQFVPNDFNGATAFIFLNTYVDGDGSWSTQVSFDSATGTVSNDAGATASNSLPLVKGQWVELKLVVDLDDDLQTFFYNGSQLYSGTWKSQYDDVGVANLGALDLFANDASAVYYDDIRIAPTKP